MKYRVTALALVTVIVCATAGLALTFSTGGATVGQLPKLKQPGVIEAHASTGTPTAELAHFAVAWTTGLRLRDSSETEALTVTPAGHEPQDDGLHLTAAAARALAADLLFQSARNEGAVNVDNRRDHGPNVWERLSDADAVTLAAAIYVAVEGH